MGNPALLRLTAHVIRLSGETDFDGWRDAARRLVLVGVPPEEVAWEVGLEDGSIGRCGAGVTPTPYPSPQGGGESGWPAPDRRHLKDEQATAPEAIAGDLASPPPSPLWGGVRGGDEEDGKDWRKPPPPAKLTVSRDFIERAQTVICHSDPERFALLYRMLWRMRDEPALLKISSDADVRRFEAMEKAVRRDIHKMRAFVRFREIGVPPEERYVAWFEPEHSIVERNASFFVRRFTGMRWSILTPKGSAHWDGEALILGHAASRGDAPADDATEDLWRTYFRNIFNPARLKVKAMQAEMPKKYWKNLPEAGLIPDLISGADEAAREMIARMPSTPAPHHDAVKARHWPAGDTGAMAGDGTNAATIGELRAAAEGCRRCPLWQNATQTVFGEGPEHADVVFVGEQPGDQEDLAGRPFVGPAGKVFDAILEEAAIDREKAYVTNAVKHFKFEPRGKRRIHARPNVGEIKACRWWLDRELAVLKPKLAVALGATAAQSLLGKAVPITKMRGEVVEREDGLRVFLTIHPSFILRIPDAAEKEAERRRFRNDLVEIGRLMAG